MSDGMRERPFRPIGPMIVKKQYEALKLFMAKFAVLSNWEHRRYATSHYESVLATALSSDYKGLSDFICWWTDKLSSEYAKIFLRHVIAVCVYGDGQSWILPHVIKKAIAVGQEYNEQNLNECSRNSQEWLRDLMDDLPWAPSCPTISVPMIIWITEKTGSESILYSFMAHGPKDQALVLLDKVSHQKHWTWDKKLSTYLLMSGRHELHERLGFCRDDKLVKYAVDPEYAKNCMAQNLG